MNQSRWPVSRVARADRRWRSSILALLLALGAWALPAAARQDVAPAPDDGPSVADARQLINDEEYEDAAEILKAITRRDPENADAWFLLGFALHGAGDLDQALPAHLMAAEFPSVAPTAMYNVACVYALKNKRDKAFDWLTRAAEAGFTRSDALRGDPDLASLREDERWEPFFKKYARPARGLVALTQEQAEARRRAMAERRRAGEAEAAPAPTTPPRPPAPPATTAPSTDPAASIAALAPERRLDFWVGTWDVLNPEGVKVGINHIRRDLGGHLIFEDWTSARGGRGQSMNYFDPSKKKWVQVWVAQGGDIIIKEGGFRDGAMRLEGRHILPDGTERAFRSSLTPHADGSIRQFIEESEDGGATWKKWFEGRYVRQEM